MPAEDGLPSIAPVADPFRPYRPFVSETDEQQKTVRRVGEPQDWALPNKLGDPLLGLRYEQLTELWQETGLPEGWSRAFAAEIAHATQAVISRQIGLMSGERTRWTGAAKALVGVCLAERWNNAADDQEPDYEAHLEREDGTGELPLGADLDGSGEASLLPTPFSELLEIHELVLADPTVGWGSGPGGLRRLYEYNVVCGPFRSSGKRGENRTWGLTSATDFESLDRAFGEEATKARPLMAVAGCAAFAAPRRTVSVAGIPEEVELPSMFEFVATLLVWGADEARRRLLEFLNEEAAREVAPRSDRPDGGPVADTTLGTIASDAYSWMLRAHEVAPAYPSLRTRWANKPVRVSLVELQQTITTWRANRTAVPLLLYRRKRAELITVVEQSRRRDGTLDPTRALRVLKRLVLFLLLGELSARIGEIARLTPASFIEQFELAGYTTPAFVIKTSKRGRRIGGPVQQIKPVTAETARYFKELMSLCGIQLDDPKSLWMSHFAYAPEDRGAYAVEHRRTGPRLRPTSLSGALVRSRKGRSEPLLARPEGRGGYAAHAFRHLGSQLASAVGTAFFQHHPDLMVKISHEVFSAATLGHQLAQDRLGYRDLEANRTLWTLRTALGDPQANIAGVLDLLTSDAGARCGWDIDRIRGALIRLRIVQQRIEQANQHLAALRLQRRALCDQPLPPVPTRRNGMTASKKLDVMLDRDLAREQRDRERDILDDRIEQAHEQRDTANAARDSITRELDLIREAGRNHPLPDDLPTRDELDPSASDASYAFDDETWEQALARADVRLDLLALEQDAVSLRVRNCLNLAEFAAVLGMTPSALRKRLRGEHEPFFPLHGTDSPLIIIGDPATSKLRFIDIDKLPASFLPRLLPEQREMIEQLLAVPMGSTRWGGRAHNLSPNPSSG